MSAASLKQHQTGKTINLITLDTLIGLPCRLDDAECNKFIVLFYDCIIFDWTGFEHSVWLEDEWISICLLLVSITPQVTAMGHA